MKLWPRPRPRRRAAAGDDGAPVLTPAGLDAVEVTARTVRAGDDWCQTLAIVGYPAEVSAGWLEPLIAYPGKVDVTLHIEPIPVAVAAQRLRRQRGRLESTRRADASHGRLDDPAVDAAAADAAELAGQLARGEGKLFRLALYLTVHADSEPDLAEVVADVRSVASSMLLDAVPTTWRMLQGWVSGLPLGVDQLAMTRTFDTQALAASFPFTSPDLPTGDGSGREVLFGLNLSSAGIVVWDRWAQHNYNSIILARSGAGKSYLAKLDMLRNLYAGVEVMVIDPEDEYIALAEAVGGTVIRPGSAGVRLNPLELDVANADALNNRASFLHTFVQVLLGGQDTPQEGVLPADQAAALDKAVLDAYRDKGVTSDPRSWRRRPPVLADVATALRARGEAGTLLADRLAPYVSGSRAGLFDGTSTHTVEGHLAVYAIRDLADEMVPAATLLILDKIWRRVTTTGQRPDGTRTPRLVVVDEAWLTLRSGLGAKWMERMAKSARKYGCGLSVITQDAGDVLSTTIGKAVVSNAATQILLRQATQAIDAVSEAFNLTDGERGFLLTAGLGDALLVAGTHHVAFRAVASPAEHELAVNSPFADPGTPTPA